MSSSARFHLISGNRLDALAAELGARLAQAGANDSLLPDTILVPQPSLRQWLQQTLAERHGIAANLDLLTPSEFVWRLLRSASATPLPDTSPWDRERLHWRIYALLGRLGKQELPPAVRRYLQRTTARSGDAGTQALARYGLADSLASAFDRYQAYRRDWLDDWERGGDRDDWQAMLWRELHAESQYPHRAALIGDWLTRYDRRGGGHSNSNSTSNPSDTLGAASRAHTTTPPPGLPARLAAFGTIHVSPDVLHVLAVAGQWCALDFYLPTPSSEYWGDVESLRVRLRRDSPAALPAALADLQRDNPPLASWGGGGREILAQLFSYEIVQPEMEIERFVDPGRDTLLRRLQQDVLHRAAPIAEAWSRDDASVQIHACHSKLREIEILHDRLRAMLDDAGPDGRRFDPPLQPREIAVMAPNIGDYLPLARAVFGGLDADDPRYIPFTLADRPQIQAHALIGWFLALLDMGDTPLSASGFRDLVAIAPVMQTLGLSNEDLARLDDWFAAAGIRWGEDAAARERAGVGRWREYSFDFGFERLLTGYAAGDDAETLRGARDDPRDNVWIAPYAELEGGDAAVLDRALDVYARLRALAAWMREPHSATEWRQRLSDTVVALIGANAQDSAEAQARRWLLDALDTLAEDAADAGLLPLAVVREALDAQLSQASVHQPWLAGGVTFSGMVPLRTVPFRVICLLGLDADAYPRREPAQDIDRLVDAVQGRAPRRLGDRSVREDDRFLFLQLLCAAGDVFYLSYGGRDARDGSLREPAGPIAELLDTLERMDGGIDGETNSAHGGARAMRLRERIALEHPLQPFSPRAFGSVADGDENDAGDTHYFSYRDEWRVDAAHAGVLTLPPRFLTAPLPPRANASEDASSPTRDALQAFFANPAKVWLKERLGLRLTERESAANDREPLGADGLQRHDTLAILLRTLPPSLDDRNADDSNTDAQTNEDTPEALEDIAQHLRARAALPPGRDGDLLIDDALPLARALRRAARASVDAAVSNARETVAASAPIEFAFNDVLRDEAGHALRLVIETGKIDGKRRLRAGIDHLLLASIEGATARTVLIGEGAKAKSSSKKADAEAEPPVETLIFGGINAETAREHLRTLLALWREGRDAPLPFAPKAAWAYVDTLRTHKKPDPETAWDEARKIFDPRRQNTNSPVPGEAQDTFIALAFRPEGFFDAFDNPLAQRFRAIARVVFDALPIVETATPTASARSHRKLEESAE
jgi:exodeoxyribonuclease V gamma subunit